MSPHWQSFHDEIRRWRDAGRTAEFWWRDDDAERPSPALARLLALRAAAQVPIALAVIPALAEKPLFEELADGIDVLQHGVDHRNRAQAGEKKTEFSVHEGVETALSRLGQARERLENLAGSRVLAVLAPPWNRIPKPLAEQIHRAGFVGLSTYGIRGANFSASGVKQVDTHVDIVAWRHGRGFAGEEQLLAQTVSQLTARRISSAGSSGPVGWLTHHAVHDEAAWDFFARLLDATRETDGVRWVSAAEIFIP